MNTFTFLNVRRSQNYPPIVEIQDLFDQYLKCEQSLSNSVLIFKGYTVFGLHGRKICLACI